MDERVIDYIAAWVTHWVGEPTGDITTAEMEEFLYQHGYVLEPVWKGCRLGESRHPTAFSGSPAMPRRRYPSDLTDAEWAVLEPLVPAPKPGGRPAVHARREVVDAVLYVLRNGTTWRALPHDLPPWQTVYDYFRRWRDDGTWEAANAARRERSRVRAGREPTPSAAILDSQSAKTTEKGGRAGTTPARRSRGASATCSSTPRGLC